MKKDFQQQQTHSTGESLHDVEPSSFSSLLDSLYEKEWVVYCKKPFRTPHHVVQYLSRYTHKTAIYNNRLHAIDGESVIFRYRDYKDEGKFKFMKLHAMEFMRRFMLHVLPSGFQRIRYYGRYFGLLLWRSFATNADATPKQQLTRPKLHTPFFDA